jgi:hypothetical protein
MDTTASPTNKAISFGRKSTRERSDVMSKLNAKRRNALPGGDFAGPDRSYPIEDASHARNALARVSQFGSPSLKARVRAKVHKEWPSIGVAKLKKAGKISEKKAEKFGL